jgi:hypothetical protein
MSQEIQGLLVTYQKVFIAREEEIKAHLLKYYKDVFSNVKVTNVERIDATEKLEISGFRKNISSWRDAYKNIYLSTCIIVDGVQKRYDYKFSFFKEQFLFDDINKIKKTIDEIPNLRANLNLKVAVVKLDSATKLAKEIKIPRYMEELENIKKEIEVLERNYNKELDQLVEKIKMDQEKKDIKSALENCEKIIHISESINRTDLMSKYKQIAERITNEMLVDKIKRKELDEEIITLEKKFQDHKQKGNISDSINTCKKIIQISEKIDNIDLKENYTQILNELNIEKRNLEHKHKELKTDLKRLDDKIRVELDKNHFEIALNDARSAVEISHKLNDEEKIKKYKWILNQILEKKSIIEAEYQKLQNELENLEHKVEKDLKTNQLNDVVIDIARIIEISKKTNNSNLTKKYSEKLEEIKQQVEDSIILNEKFGELKKTIETLNQEGLNALEERNLSKSLEKYREIKSQLINYLK